MDIEIDGKQHERPKDREHDIKRDGYLQSIGWVVIRIPARQLKSIIGKFHEMIEEALN